MKKIIATGNAPAAIGPYSQAVEAGGLIFISGQLPLDPATGAMAPAEIKAQTEAVIKNLEGILKSEGLSLEHVLKTTVFMADLGQFAAMNEVYGRFFAANPPARATIEVKALPKAALVEIEAVAAR
ncbi:MAG TPA: reactive intermediate/imine deaminase [Elusimicrobia bacterium]|nr:MAG: reactive intermediate/imine deaminase [Elusimicrobia bacterium GWA2_64_40]OGR63818.1 MAG: reactive intermediate/imine deaminase [Elusimicrobia bacterium GWB2_63_16]HAN04884.1 reactive intermediate/imine deaminase [Elusimicrobiota bacterium]HAU89529.1 reactive intermediate/imine deaminase [Elusimicrobiota bacterium]